MRVLIATMQFASGYAQGTERYVRTLSRGLKAAEHEVSVLAGDPEGRRADIAEFSPVDDPDCRVVHCPTNGWLAIEGRASVRGWLSENRPDVLHLTNPAHIGIGVLEAAHELGVPSVVTTTDLWWVWPIATGPADLGWGYDEIRRAPDKHWLAQAAEQRGGLGKPMAAVSSALLHPVLAKQARRGFDEWRTRTMMAHWKSRPARVGGALRGAGAVIYPSPGTRELIEPLRAGSPHAGNDASFGYGLDAAWFQERNPPETPTLFYAGALTPHKGLHVLLSALRRCETGPRLVVAGDWGQDGGRYRKKCEALADGLDVRWAGRLDEEGVRESLRGATAVVLPSVWRENLPFTVLEAHASGVPVIASDIVGVVGQVPAEWRFAVGNDAGLAAKIDSAVRGELQGGVGPVMSAGEFVERTLKVYRAAGAGSGVGS